MFRSTQYQLLDFGDGRKLERFGPYVLDRPSPAADGLRPAEETAWKLANARYERSGHESGRWSTAGSLPPVWTLYHKQVVFQLRRTASGQVGLFAEQAENWDWLSRRVEQAGDRRLKVLNLFAYTGGSTLTAAAAGAHVVHVDAARSAVEWARDNANRSGLSQSPIRWITDDARKFIQRELRRGNHYDAVILNPPTYGHGAKGESWQIQNDLVPLLGACGQLTAPQPAFVLLTCHWPGYGPAELSECVRRAFLSNQRARELVAKPLSLNTPDGRSLPAGMVVRWP